MSPSTTPPPLVKNFGASDAGWSHTKRAPLSTNLPTSGTSSAPAMETSNGKVAVRLVRFPITGTRRVANKFDPVPAPPRASAEPPSLKRPSTWRTPSSNSGSAFGRKSQMNSPLAATRSAPVVSTTCPAGAVGVTPGSA